MVGYALVPLGFVVTSSWRSAARQCCRCAKRKRFTSGSAHTFHKSLSLGTTALELKELEQAAAANPALPPDKQLAAARKRFTNNWLRDCC